MRLCWSFGAVGVVGGVLVGCTGGTGVSCRTARLLCSCGGKEEHQEQLHHHNEEDPHGQQ